MEKVYKMPGYDLHLLPTNKFKNITISLKLQNTLDEKTVAKLRVQKNIPQHKNFLNI